VTLEKVLEKSPIVKNKQRKTINSTTKITTNMPDLIRSINYAELLLYGKDASLKKRKKGKKDGKTG